MKMATKKNVIDPMARVRKLGEREEIVEVPLTQREVEDLRHELCVQLDRVDEIEAKKTEFVQQNKAEMATVDLEISRCRGLIKSRRKNVKLLVEDWLTQGNDVIRMVPMTGEIIGDVRRARAEELQEKLFKDTEPTIPPPSDEEFDTSDSSDGAFGEPH